jgi:hypothetical protein
VCLCAFHANAMLPTARHSSLQRSARPPITRCPWNPTLHGNCANRAATGVVVPLGRCWVLRFLSRGDPPAREARALPGRAPARSVLLLDTTAPSSAHYCVITVVVLSLRRHRQLFPWALPHPCIHRSAPRVRRLKQIASRQSRLHQTLSRTQNKSLEAATVSAPRNPAGSLHRGNKR